jgi:hypothetical protein
VDRPNRTGAIVDYPVLWAAGDVEFSGKWLPAVEDYLKRGGTLVVNLQAAKGKLPPDWLGVRFTDQRQTAAAWSADGSERPATPYEVERVQLTGARPLAWAGSGVPLITRHQVGEGAVILTLVPRMLGLDERAHPALPFLMNGLVSQLLPVEVLLPGGQRPEGEIMYQLNRTKNGHLVTLVNNRGVDKTQNGIARVDRRAWTDVVLRTKLSVQSATEYTQPRELSVEKKGAVQEVRLRVHPGDVQVVQLVTAP